MKKSDLLFLKKLKCNYEYNNLEKFLNSSSVKEENAYKSERLKGVLTLLIFFVCSMLIAFVIALKSSILASIVTFVCALFVTIPIIFAYSKVIKDKHELGYLSVLKRKFGESVVLKNLKNIFNVQENDFQSLIIKERKIVPTLVKTENNKIIKSNDE